MAPLSSPLSSVWADSAADGGLSTEFMSATILMLQKEKEKDSHQTPLTNALANINALLIHPICCLIAFLYTVIWHLLLKSGAGVRRGGGGGGGRRGGQTDLRLSLPVMDARLWIIRQACQCS